MRDAYTVWVMLEKNELCSKRWDMEGFFSFWFSADCRQYIYTVSYLLSAVFLKVKALEVARVGQTVGLDEQ